MVMVGMIKSVEKVKSVSCHLLIIVSATVTFMQIVAVLRTHILCLYQVLNWAL